jgi:spoIIIJ-associated protein
MQMDYTTQISDLTRTFLDQIGFGEEVQVKVTFEEADSLYSVSLSSPNPAMLIGYHGDTLSSLQLLLSQHLFSLTNEWVPLSLNVNDYRERRESSLKTMVDDVISRVISTGQPHALPPMPANERRIIHVYLSDHSDVITESSGEGRMRSVVISPRPVSAE